MPQRKYRHLFFDLDHTLWDFDANARATLEQLHLDLHLPDRGIHDFDHFYQCYIGHNEKLWDRYRKGYIKQEELRLKRMWLTLLDFQVADEALSRELSDLFLQLMPTRTLIFPDTVEVLDYLQGKGYGLHMITNGFEQIQHTKLRVSGLSHYFQNIVTSEGSNSLKPQPEIFYYALEKAGASVEESLMIGDNLEVDIEGAHGVGMDGVHVNFTNTPQTFQPAYTITGLKQLMDIL
ncbi:MAG: noncanonical pyrimidine nucleotidase, YjjG family [Chitinophagaceae bacterium]|nr:MAG: noncanonical pyrimidine nucleotidase, YjjG family [Chitinophagaceae bacterium]